MSSYSLVTQVERPQWDAFLKTHHPDSFLHSWTWGAFNESQGDRAYRVGVAHEGTIVAVALLLRIHARRGSFVFCPHGPIAAAGESLPEILTLIRDEAVRWAKETQCVFVRWSPLLPASTEHHDLLAGLGFRQAPIHMHPELAWILDLAPDEEALLKGMRKTTRHAIRDAEAAGVQVEMSDRPEDVERFWQVYEPTVARQHFSPFSKKYLREECEAFAQEGKLRLCFGSLEGETVSAAIAIFDEHSGYYHHGASIPQPKIPVSHLVQWHLIKEAKRLGCTRYNFWGIAPPDDPKHPWAGLSRFKQGFGGQAYAYEHAVDLPLSPRYWITYGIETIRRMKRGL